MRYMRRLYGVSITATVRCEHCDFSEEISMSEEAAGSEFNELV
jgi:hypothetical protein